MKPTEVILVAYSTLPPAFHSALYAIGLRRRDGMIDVTRTRELLRMALSSLPSPEKGQYLPGQLEEKAKRATAGVLEKIDRCKGLNGKRTAPVQRARKKR
jgi:hypothetical protein